MSRHISATRLVSLKRQLPAPDVLKDLLKFQAPAIDRRKVRLEAAKDIWDLRAIAQRRTPKGPFDYVDGAAEKELSLQRARL